MRIYALIVRHKGAPEVTRSYWTSLEDAVDRLAAIIHQPDFEEATLYQGELHGILTYTNPRRPEA